MKLTVLLTALAAHALAGWPSAGGNNGRNGLSPWAGPHEHQVRWEAQTLPATISMQCFTEETLAVTMRYCFSPMQGPLVCHDLRTGDTAWTRLYKPGGKYIPVGMKQGRVYCRDFRESGRDTIYCVDAATGDIRWQSRWTAPLGIVWDAIFTTDGDPVLPGAEHGVMRLDRLTGDTVWVLDRPTPNTGAEWMAAHDTVLFTWKGFLNTPKKLLAVSLNTGRILDSTAALPGDGDQEQPMAVGPDGTIFAQRDGGLLHALRYTDSGFVELWTRTGGGSVWMNYGSSPDGSFVYIPVGRRLLMIDAATGSEAGASEELVTGGDLVPRVSVDRDGFLYVMATTGTGEGRLWCLDAGLRALWNEDYGYSYYSGPAIGDSGVVVVAGAGTTIRAYAPATAVAERGKVAAPRLLASPNPFATATAISLGSAGFARVAVVDATGRRVRTIAGTSPLDWNGTDDAGSRLPAGTYLIRSLPPGLPGSVRIVMTN
jgi:outer membrane protein assembly factor BamB